MTIIEATSGTYRSRVDGTIVLSVEISPVHAKAALELFGMPGTSIALAALKDGHGAVPDKPEKPKGGALSKLAGMWCDDPQFWEWVNSSYWRLDEKISDADGAAKFVRWICPVESRAELDHNPEAAKRFNELIREPYMEYLKEK